MAPFILLPCGLLWLRAWLVDGWRGAAVVAAAFLAALCINPATTVRGFTGFLESLHSARARDWHNLFGVLRPAEFFPGLTTLAVGACKHLGAVPGLALSLLLAAALAQTVRRARDPFGTVAMLAGGGVLLVYTWVTGFQYGWQKTAQFTGVFLGAIFPAGCLAALPRGGFLPRVAAGALGVFFGYATVSNFAASYLYADRKFITREMLALRQVSNTRFNSTPVLVVSESFPKAYFYSMWAAYLFPHSSLMFTARSEESGGYLRETVLFETPGVTPPAAAVFVNHEWAESFDLNSRRLIDGIGFALLENTNRVLGLKGFYPESGVPRYSAARVEIRLTPHRDSWLRLSLRPRLGYTQGSAARLVVENRVEGEPTPRRLAFDASLPPWEIVLPLRGSIQNEITWEFDAPPELQGELPFEISGLRITDAP